jgi:hypothetical protein
MLYFSRKITPIIPAISPMMVYDTTRTINHLTATEYHAGDGLYRVRTIMAMLSVKHASAGKKIQSFALSVAKYTNMTNE